jgi:hypothetical protein
MTDVLTCSSCGAQYLSTAVACADCGTPLVEGPRLEPPAPDAEVEEVGYDLADWRDDQRRDLGLALAPAGVASRWEGTDLVVRLADADHVEALIDDIDSPDALAVDEEEVDDDGGAELLSALYVAADVLQHDPSANVAVIELLEAAERASELGPPYGLDGDLWREVQRRADALADLLGEEAEDDDVMAAARALREAVHPLV